MRISDNDGYDCDKDVLICCVVTIGEIDANLAPTDGCHKRYKEGIEISDFVTSSFISSRGYFKRSIARS